MTLIIPQFHHHVPSPPFTLIHSCISYQLFSTHLENVPSTSLFSLLFPNLLPCIPANPQILPQDPCYCITRIPHLSLSPLLKHT